ncbi:hypothetical protein DL89DRAFT_268763 [Linderina pennispora]|uniref:Uncharacterized protein n=1 Tax=Linderina pennispora TaxID=61395 RepID=A0A1Y1W4Y5_9FUNG|nr:uncharacterized protein DL89DRAFT_268763 [Linderina pennispora]ORX68254.1 hypothetical protein DL89DRAFT_268763 [Linderina pennispora]
MSDIQICIQQLEHTLATMGIPPGTTLSPLSSDFSFDEDMLSSVPVATLPVYTLLLED